MKTWSQVEEDQPIFDTEAEFAQCTDNNGRLSIGMIHKQSKKLHGLVLGITKNSEIFEASFKDGMNHGLHIMY